jgi:hypothetical protein
MGEAGQSYFSPSGIFGRKPSTLRSNCINGYRSYGPLKNASPQKTIPLET